MLRSTGLILLGVGITLSAVGVIGAVFMVNQGGHFAATVCLLAGPGLVGTLMIFGGIRLMRGRHPIGAPIEPIAGRVGGYLADTLETRQAGELSYEVLYRQPIKGKNARPSSLTVRINANAPSSLRFNDETWFDKWCKRMGITRECQTGDEIFDDSVFVRGPSIGFAELYLHDPEKRNAIIQLRQMGFQEVRLTGSEIEAEWKGFDPQKDDQSDLAALAAEKLHVLARDIPKEDPDGIGHRTDSRLASQVVLWFFAILFGASFLAVYAYPPIHESNLLIAVLATFVIAYPVFGWISAYFLSGTSTSHDKWARLMSVGVLLFGLGSCGMVSLINGFEDDSPEDDRTSVITEKRISEGRRGSKTYYATVAAWDRPDGTIEFKVPAGSYDGIVAGKSKLELKTKKGRLDIEWLNSKQVRP